MKKRRNLNEIAIIPIPNPVAKHAHRFNKAHVFVDKSKYRRNAKHAKQEAFPVIPAGVTGKASCVEMSASVSGKAHL